MTGVPIEPDAETRAALSAAAVDFVNRYIDQRASSPASSSPTDPSLIAELLAAPDESGAAIETLLEKLDSAIDTGFDTGSGGFLSYIPTGGVYTGALGSFLASATNRYTGGAHASPGAVAIEQSVIDWMTSLFGLPDGSAGILLSGGSIANLTAMVTARSQLGDTFRDGVVYASERSHHSISKAARIAGISSNRVRSIPTDTNLRMDSEALRAAVDEDLAAGLHPMMITATAGTTDTGAIDPIDACADIAASSGAWFHVDAAYGGFFQLTERGRERLSGIGRADSITVDAHKSLLLPFGVGGLLVRDARHLVAAHEGHGAYMQDVIEGDLPHYLAMGPELTRPNRGLAVWLPLHLHGVARFRDTLDRMLDLAENAAQQLETTPGIEITGPPELSVVAFRATGGDEQTFRIFDALNDSREVHVSSTTINDRAYIRFAFLSQRTTGAIANRAVELVQDAITDSAS